MTKAEFLKALEGELSRLPREEIDRSLSYYAEIIDDRTEDGMGEQEAVAALGNVREIAQKILDDVPISRIIQQRMREHRPFHWLTILLLILGFPMWFPLLMTAVSVILTFVVVLWAIDFSLWAVVFALSASGLGCVIGGVVAAVHSGWQGVAMIGGGLFCAGLGILAFLCVFQVTLWLGKLMMVPVRALKRKLLNGKGRSK